MNCTTNHSTAHCRGAMRDIVFIVLVLGLIAWGIEWLARRWGAALHQDITVSMKAKKQAEELACRENLQAVYEALTLCSTSGEPIPQNKDELLKWCGGNKTFRCPDPNGSEYVYIPPKSLDDSPPDLIVYEPNAVHDGKSHILLSDGSIGLVTPEKLQAILKALKAKSKGRP